MKYFVLILFFLPSLSFGALSITQASSTHALGFDAVGDFTSTTAELRIYAPGAPATYPRNNACAVFTFNHFHPGFSTNNVNFSIRPQRVQGINLATAMATVTNLDTYQCKVNGVYTVGIFTNAAATSALSSDTIYLEQLPLDFKSTFMLLFLIGALLAVLRPVISKLTLR